jgi:hypothetical protein
MLPRGPNLQLRGIQPRGYPRHFLLELGKGFTGHVRGSESTALNVAGSSDAGKMKSELRTKLQGSGLRLISGSTKPRAVSNEIQPRELSFLRNLAAQK